jgi:hypothetical protein
MSRHAALWRLKYAITSIGATIIIGGTVSVPLVVSAVGSPPAAGAVSGLTDSPLENNWG